MKILSISNLDIWPMGRGKGIPSISVSQKGFVENGHIVYFICPLKEKSAMQQEEYEGIHIFRFKLPFGLSSLRALSLNTSTFLKRIYAAMYYNFEWLFFQIFGFYWLFRYASRIKPDIIYVHTTAPAFIAFIISKIFHTKLVMRVYGLRDLYYKWDFFWQKIKESRDYLSLKVPMDYLIVTNDGTNANLLLEKLGIPGAKIKNWRNGVDFNIYNHSLKNKQEVYDTLGICSTSKIIISTSQLNSYYGIDILVKALVILFKEDNDAISLFMGDGPLREQLENYVQCNGLQKRIRFLGIVKRDMLIKFLNASDIFVLLSRFSNCSNVMWEAMACGKCIVTTENENIKGVLTSGENAVLVNPAEFKKTPEILKELLSNDELRNKLGGNACLRAREILETWPQRIEREVELLEGLI